MTAAASAAFAGAVNRIARATSIIRTRREDAARAVRHGGRSADLEHRLDDAAARLERVALRLERAIEGQDDAG